MEEKNPSPTSFGNKHQMHTDLATKSRDIPEEQAALSVKKECDDDFVLQNLVEQPRRSDAAEALEVIPDSQEYDVLEPVQPRPWIPTAPFVHINEWLGCRATVFSENKRGHKRSFVADAPPSQINKRPRHSL
jgi:hypothetical protein